jgi:hypothetical protein
MSRKRFTTEKIIGMLREEAEVAAEGACLRPEWKSESKRLDLFPGFSLESGVLGQLAFERQQHSLSFVVFVGRWKPASKWIKEHLRIKTLYGAPENVVKTQIWIAVALYVLVAIVKKRMQIGLSLYTILQISSLTLFAKMPLYHPFAQNAYKNKIATIDNQLELFNP